MSEEHSKSRGMHLFEAFGLDLVHGFRVLRMNPGLTLAAVFTVALGIGANTAIFSVLNGLFLRPLPVRAPNQIVLLATDQRGGHLGPNFFSYPDFVDFRDQASEFSDVFAYAGNLAGLSDERKADQIVVNYVTGNYFSALGLKPLIGRLLLPSDEENGSENPVLVLGYSYWEKRFGGAAGVIGKEVRVNGQPLEIVGVAPKQFHGLYAITETDAYVPLRKAGMVEEGVSQVSADRGARVLRTYGRLKPGVSLAQAQSSVNVIASRLEQQYPATDRGVTVRLIPERLARPEPAAANPIPLVVSLFLILSGLVLLLACTNVASILMVRATARRREMALRTALGAGRWQLIRQVLTESVLLGILGGFAGVALGMWVGAALSSIPLSTSLPLRMDFRFDWRVFTYALGVALLTGIVFGLWPALRASRADIGTILRDGGNTESGGPRGHRIRNSLVVLELAGSLMLLIVAGLFVRSLRQAGQMKLGFEPDHLLNVMLDPHEIGYDQPRGREFYRQLESSVSELPGVTSVSLASSVPMGTLNAGTPVFVEGHPVLGGERPPVVLFNRVDPTYFETMRIPLLRGRGFGESDTDTSPLVGIVNQTMARRFWPSEDPIGKRFSVKGATGPFVEIVGIATDGKYLGMVSDPLPYFYVPLAQNYKSMLVLQARSSLAPESLISSVRQKVRDLAPDLPVIKAETMEQSLAGVNGFLLFRLGATLAAAMGFIGLVLAVVGVYGIVSYAAAQRTKEIGIRMALGANPRNVLLLVFRQGAGLVATGVILGLLSAVALTRAMSRLFVGVGAFDAFTYGSGALLMAIVALWACYIPARRAVRVEPMVALRYE